MFKASVVEKVFGQVVVNTYVFLNKEQMLMFKNMCEEDGDIVIAQASA